MQGPKTRSHTVSGDYAHKTMTIRRCLLSAYQLARTPVGFETLLPATTKASRRGQATASYSLIRPPSTGAAPDPVRWERNDARVVSRGAQVQGVVGSALVVVLDVGVAPHRQLHLIRVIGTDASGWRTLCVPSMGGFLGWQLENCSNSRRAWPFPGPYRATKHRI